MSVQRPQRWLPMKAASTFPYQKYARVMLDYSVGGIRPGELCVLGTQGTAGFHLELEPRLLQAYGRLLERGYRVGVNVLPETLERYLQSPPVRSRHQAVQRELRQGYHQVLTLGPTLDAASLRALDARLSDPHRSGKRLLLTLLSADADPLADALVRGIAERGGIPLPLGTNPWLDSTLLAHARTVEQVRFQGPEFFAFRRMDKRLQSARTPPLDRLPPPTATGSRPALAQALTERQRALGAIWMDRMARIELGPRPEGKVFRSLGLSPSEGQAQEVDMTLEEFGTFYEKITQLDRADPVAYYQALDARVQHYARQLQRFSQLRLVSDDGRTQLDFSIREPGESRSRYVAPSTATGNALPAEIFTSPVEDSLEGRVYFDLPFQLKGTAEVFRGLTLKFEQGRVVQLSVEEGNEELLRDMMLNPESPHYVPGFDRTGEFAVGFNRLITELLKGKVARNTLIAEKQDIHIAMGEGYRVTGGKNSCAIHQDITLSSGPGSGMQLEARGEGFKTPMVLYRDGEFTQGFLGYEGS